MYTGFDTDLIQLGTTAVARGAISDIATDTAGGATLVVTNYDDDSVSLIDVNDLSVESTVAVCGEPMSAVVADNRIYVATSSPTCDAVVVVDADAKTAIAACPIDSGITSLAVSPDRKHVYVGRTSRDGTDIAVIDVTTEQVDTIDIAAGAGVIDVVRVSPDGTRLYAAVCNAHADRLVVVDTEAARVVVSVLIGSPVRDLAVSPEGGLVYVLVADPRRGGVVFTVDTKTNSITDTITIGGWPTQMVLSPDGTHAYIANRDHVTVVCAATNEIVDTVRVGAQPSSVAVSPDSARLYIADYHGVVTSLSVAPTVTLPTVHAVAMDLMNTRDGHALQSAAV